MALRFFWRCESASLTASVDYSIGDTSATAAGTNSASISFHADAAKLGTNGVWCDGSLQYYAFDTISTLIAQTAEGAIGFWIRFPDSVPGSGYDYGVTAIGASASDYIKVQTASSGNMRLSLSQNGGSVATISTTGANMQASTWYFVVARWDHANTRARVEIYSGTSTTPLGTGESAAVAANSQATSIALSTGFRVGNGSSQTLDCHIDNVFVADDYDEPLHLHGNRDITDVDSYTATLATKYVKVLADAVAASATAIEGVVLSAARDTVIGEFTAQAFEASLEAGEAVLLIAATDITPDGNLLTTTDTPIVFAYNATESLVGPASATVIEV